MIKKYLPVLCFFLSCVFFSGCDRIRKIAFYPLEKRGDGIKIESGKSLSSFDFYEICANGNRRQISKAIRDGASVNALDENGFSPLFYAVVGNPEKYSEALASIQAALRSDNDDDLYNALDYAKCVNGNIDAVRLLLENGANLQISDRKKNTAFLYACLFCRNPEILEELVNAGADMTEQLSANYPQPLLNFAAFTNDSPECVYYIAQTGKNIGISNQFGTSAVMWASMYNKNPLVIDALVNAGADINDPNHKDGYTPLHWAIRCNRNPSVVEHILNLGADIDKRDKYGSSPLLWAVFDNNPNEVIKAIGTSFNGDDFYDSPEYFENFMQRGKPRLVSLLLKYRPASEDVIEAYRAAYCLSSSEIAGLLLESLSDSPNISYGRDYFELMCCSSDKVKIDALKKVLLKPENSNSINPDSSMFADALRYRNLEVIQTITDDFGLSSDYNAVRSAINYSCYDTFYDEFLVPVVKACDNINRQNEYGQTLLNYAVQRRNLAAVKAIIQHGGKIDMRYGENYYTELIAAVNCDYPDTEIVKSLIAAGADVNARDKYGSSVLAYAVNKNHTGSAARILINAGANKKARANDFYVYEYCNEYIKNTDVYWTLYNAVFY